jgi:hypothetical protein
MTLRNSGLAAIHGGILYGPTKGQTMVEQLKSGNPTKNGLIERAWRALTGRGRDRSPAKATSPVRMSDIHPHGSCARNSRPPDFSDLFAPETPDSEERKY